MKRPNAAKPTCPADENVDMTLHSVNDVRTGMKIEHKQFGIGIIEALGNVSGMPSIVVEFKKNGEKESLASICQIQNNRLIWKHRITLYMKVVSAQICAN